MQIKHLDIKRFIPLTFSHIDRLSMDCHQGIHLVVGDNGCGKSSLINEIVPFAAGKNIYNKGGYKKLTLSHNDHQYELESHIDGKSSTHSFKKDGSELNDAQGTRIQNELVEEHLGLSPLINDLTHFKYAISYMRPNDRKTLFMSTNPYDLFFILDLHKKICSAIRGVKQNITLMTTKKLEILDKKLDNDVMTTLREEHKVLMNNTNILDRLSLLLNDKADRLHNPTPYKSIQDISTRICELYDQSSNAKKYRVHVEVDDIEYMGWLKATVNSIDQQLKDLDKHIVVLQQDLNEYEKQLKQCEDGSLETISQEITSLQKYIEGIKLDSKLPTLSKEDVDKLSNQSPTINQYVDKLRDIPLRYIVPTEFIDKVYSKLQQCNYVYTNKQAQLEQLKSEYAETYNKYVQLKGLNVPEECALSCDLGDSHKSSITELSTKLKTLNTNIAALTKQCKCLFKRKTILDSYYSQSNGLRNIYMYFQQLITKYPHVLIYPTLYQQLRINANHIFHYTERLCQNTYATMDYEVHSKALKDAQLRYEIAKNTVGQSITALLKDRDRVVQQLNEQVSTYRVLQDKLNTLSNAILHGEMHKRCKDEYRALCEEFESTCKVLLDNQACEYYRSIISLVTEEKNRYTIRLRELEQILQEQNNLQNQLDTLVLPTLKELEDKLTDYTSVEAALSPTTGIPHAYTLQYLNQIISLVNLFLDKVWTYDMRLYELDINKPIDFRFKINIKGYQVPDISICSDGQRAMIDLAFCLALMAHMGILDQYPIYFDELDASLDRQHRFKMMELMNELVEHKDINQLFLIHHTNMDGFSNCSTLCLSTENITVPAVYNEHVEIDKMG